MNCVQKGVPNICVAPIRAARRGCRRLSGLDLMPATELAREATRYGGLGASFPADRVVDEGRFEDLYW